MRPVVEQQASNKWKNRIPYVEPFSVWQKLWLVLILNRKPLRNRSTTGNTGLRQDKQIFVLMTSIQLHLLLAVICFRSGPHCAPTLGRRPQGIMGYTLNPAALATASSRVSVLQGGGFTLLPERGNAPYLLTDCPPTHTHRPEERCSVSGRELFLEGPHMPSYQWAWECGPSAECDWMLQH